jgi:hypothetical protein
MYEIITFSNTLMQKIFHLLLLLNGISENNPHACWAANSGRLVRHGYHDSPDIYQAWENSLALKAPPNVVVQFPYLENG